MLLLKNRKYLPTSMCVYNHYLEFCHVLQDGDTPLHVACLRGHSDVMQTDLKSGADLKLQNKVLNRLFGIRLCIALWVMQ